MLILQLMSVQHRNILKLLGIIQVNKKDFIILVGDFHVLIHFFSDCGKFVTNSGFEDILYQVSMCPVD